RRLRVRLVLLLRRRNRAVDRTRRRPRSSVRCRGFALSGGTVERWNGKRPPTFHRSYRVGHAASRTENRPAGFVDPIVPDYGAIGLAGASLPVRPEDPTFAREASR